MISHKTRSLAFVQYTTNYRPQGISDTKAKKSLIRVYAPNSAIYVEDQVYLVARDLFSQSLEIEKAKQSILVMTQDPFSNSSVMSGLFESIKNRDY